MKEQITLSIENLIEKLLNWFDLVILNLPNLVLALFVFMISYYLSKKISKKITSVLSTRISQGSIRSLIGSAISAFFIILGIILALGILNLDQALNSLITGAGVAGLAIGLAVQGTLSNTFAGISLSLKDDINIGDFIETNGFSGTVTDINLRDTKITTLDNNIVVIPNNTISANPYKNYSLTRDMRVILELGVGYESDLSKVEEITKKAIKGQFSSQNQEIEFYYLSFGDSAINLQVRFWIEAKEKTTITQARSQAIVLVKEAFNRESINIPFPIHTIMTSN